MENYLSISASFSLYLFGSYQSLYVHAGKHTYTILNMYIYTLLREMTHPKDMRTKYDGLKVKRNKKAIQN